MTGGKASKIPVVVIVGPTAVGKTDTGVLVAQRIGGEVISADSMQIYRYMDIGTAKPTAEEMKGITHHMIDIVDPDQEFSVADFQRLAKGLIEDIHCRGLMPIVVGGTGLYVNSLVYNLDFTQTVSDPRLRKHMKEMARERGNSYIHGMLMRVDPESAAKIHPNDIKRVIRALEVYSCSGRPMSQYHRDISKTDVPYDLVMVGLMMERQDLYRRIEQRVDNMISSGLVDEVQSLLDRGYHRGMVSMQGLGYKEIIGYIYGEYSFDNAVDMLKRDTRRFAKRQFTWFNRDDRIFWIDVKNFPDRKQLGSKVIDYITTMIKT
jgi:tRNA dimethylallyltransferase